MVLFPYAKHTAVTCMWFLSTGTSADITADFSLNNGSEHTQTSALLGWLKKQQRKPLCNYATYDYHSMSHRMSSSFSGKLQKAIRNCNCSGTGGRKCSTTSNGICRATAWAVNSTNDELWPATILNVHRHQQDTASKNLIISICTINTKIISCLQHNISGNTNN